MNINKWNELKTQQPMVAKEIIRAFRIAICSHNTNIPMMAEYARLFAKSRKILEANGVCRFRNWDDIEKFSKVI